MQIRSPVRQNKVTDYLIYESAARQEGWAKLVFLGVILLTLIPAIILIQIDLIGAWVMFGATVLDAALLYFIFPRKYQIYTSEVKIVLGGPFSFKFPLSSIKEGRPVGGSASFVYGGLQLASSNKGVVEIKRRGSMDVVISPLDPDSFIEQLNRAVKEHGGLV